MNSSLEYTEDQLTLFWSTVGWKKPERVIIGFLVLNSLLAAGVVLMSNGNIGAGLILPLLTLIVLASLYRLDWAFYIFILAVLISDQFPPRGLETFTYRISYFRNLKEIPYLPYFDAGVVNPVELHLAFLFLIWIVLAVTRKKISFVRLHFWGIYLLFFVWYIFSFVWGKSRGGELLPAIWEMRALFYFALVYFFVPQVIRTREQVRTLFWVLIFGISAKALQGIIIFISLGFQTWGYEALTNSEDPVFMIVIIYLLFALSLMGGEDKQKRVLKWLVFPLFLGIYVGQRRATYASFSICLLAFLVFLPTKPARIFRRYMIIAVVVFLVYLGAFWNTYGRIGMVAQQFKAVIIKDPSVISGRDYLSNLYRDYENYNLATTIRKSPVLGIGFGNMFDNPMSFLGLERVGMLGYISHDSVLWLFVKTGAIGFILFFIFLDGFLFYVAMLASKAKDAYYRVLLIICGIAVINQVVVTFVEMQFTYHRNMILLAVLMGLLPTLRRLDQETVPASQ
jgi:hypothetical protein